MLLIIYKYLTLKACSSRNDLGWGGVLHAALVQHTIFGNLSIQEKLFFLKKTYLNAISSFIILI